MAISDLTRRQSQSVGDSSSRPDRVRRKRSFAERIEAVTEKYAVTKELLARADLGSPAPAGGWIRAVRLLLSVTTRGLAQRLNKSRQSLEQMELREIEGRVTIRQLRQAADALGCNFSYSFTPRPDLLTTLRKLEQEATQCLPELTRLQQESKLLDDVIRTQMGLEENAKEFKKLAEDCVLTVAEVEDILSDLRAKATLSDDEYEMLEQAEELAISLYTLNKECLGENLDQS